MKRPAVVAGSFYPDSIDRLKSTIEECFLSPIGPGYIPEKIDKLLEQNLAVIVPHAGYVYSGPVAAHAYAQIARSGKPELVVLIGPNHTGFGSQVSVWNQGEWLTPFGSLQVHEQAAEIFLQNCDEAAADWQSHMYEHSLEVQLPFLQYLFGEFKILPICVSPVFINTCQKIASALDEIAKKYSSVLFVFSTDLNHYENDQITNQKDQWVIEKISQKDPVGLYTVVAKQKVTMCGLSSIAALLFMKYFGRPKLLKHATSGDVTKDRTQVVGYASFICERA